MKVEGKVERRYSKADGEVAPIEIVGLCDLIAHCMYSVHDRSTCGSRTVRGMDPPAAGSILFIIDKPSSCWSQGQLL